MTDEFTKGRFKALALVSQYLKFHYYTLRLLEDVEEKIKHSRESSNN